MFIVLENVVIDAHIINNVNMKFSILMRSSVGTIWYNRK